MNSRITRLKQINKNSAEAIEIIEVLEEKLKRALQILESCKMQVGMLSGEEIEEFIADVKNYRFCSKQFNYERLPGEQ